jgi:DNA-binding XRE family transcriptional regulator
VLSKEQQDLFYKKLGELIKAARQKSKIKQEVLSKEVGLTRISIVHIEQGTQKVQLHTLVQIAKYLQLNIGDLIPPLDFDTKEISSQLAKKMDKKSLQAGLDKPESKERLTEFFKITTNTK